MVVNILYQFLLGVKRVKNKKDAGFLLASFCLMFHISDVYVCDKFTVIAGKLSNTVILFAMVFILPIP